MDSHSSDDPVCRREPPQLVALDNVPAQLTSQFEACADRSGCRAYRAADGHPGAYVVAGYPEDLARFAALVAALDGLRTVRDALERASGQDARQVDPIPVDQDLYRTREVRDRAPEVEVPAGATLLVTREFTFDAAHNLPRYVGKCEWLHGHTYRLRVTVKAPLDPWTGLAFDFHDIKTVVKERVLSVLDHRYLNEFIANPSAEHIAVWSWQQLADLPLHEIQVWETPTSYVTYCGPPAPPGSQR